MLQQNNSYKIIFHADDDEDDRMLFMDAVTELNLPIKVQQAEDGQKLLNCLYSPELEIPEIVFLDINMPGKSGFECLEEIRNWEDPLKQIKIVMLSTSSNIENVELSYKLGADLYAVKPSTFHALKSLLTEILKLQWNASWNKKQFLVT
ncbi:response regulator [Flavobacterium johnsoniae]|uniref:Response regulator receiver protein n=1 Tax=Flavobacterium johnsoniae (strain ATCC 17061 / DSM 2064 / JCM 8514 / BCRC 14874 / CCUG 350202 / NBRC 14942 / NCIMB 11054 / UW101) TaxID=376686 RepID=A5FDY4_FLAJ1|nr:response regulator [Flavobacterium johnsoniae]ABQ06581.1 response regulator receiver protein [Flavobacterium johnsoniae UW101]OXE99815.1 response regulator [Flavobacterium johnsoniae UW101]WQG82331.1 response regulator [Flavobacterium johnsoniae UW101]SHK80198.1 Response regulator receiver domain-containing protein [Flavobacterium johnsoniae]